MKPNTQVDAAIAAEIREMYRAGRRRSLRKLLATLGFVVPGVLVWCTAALLVGEILAFGPAIGVAWLLRDRLSRYLD
jgi:hypothetical protein